MSLASPKRPITGRKPNRMHTSRPSSGGRRRTRSGREVEVAGPQPFGVDVQRRDGVAVVKPHALQLCGLDEELPFVAAVDAAPGDATHGPRGNK